MFSRRIVTALAAVLVFLSISALIVNMPEKKDAAVMARLAPYIPYEMTKTVGGLDIIDKHTGEKMKIENAKAFIAFDDLTKRWGKRHLRLNGNVLLILDDTNSTVDRIQLTTSQHTFVQRFFGL